MPVALLSLTPTIKPFSSATLWSNPVPHSTQHGQAETEIQEAQAPGQNPYIYACEKLVVLPPLPVVG